MIPRVVLVLLLSCTALLQAQQPSPMPEGTSSISGKVTALDTGKPIRGAVVEIIVYNNLSTRFRQVTTDADGKFEFTKLPAGQYLLASQAPRYIRMQYGQQQPGPPGMLNPARTIELKESQALTTADFALWGYCAIEGRLTDEFGDPAPNVAIQVSQVLYGGGRQRLSPVGSSVDGPRVTDDLGQFRIGGLAPGDYYVEALSGAFADPSAAGGFAVTFFPGTTKPSAAQVVSLKPGADSRNVSFSLTPATMARVSGTLIDGTGRPMSKADLMLMPSETAGTVLFMFVRSGTDQNGQFTFRNVPPGTYTIQAFGTPVGGSYSLMAAPFGYKTFSVDGKNLDGLTVTVPAARSLRGHIAFDGDMSMLPKATSDVFISARPVNFESAPIGGGPGPSTIRDDWTFELGAMSGLRMVTAGTRSGWIMKKATLNGQDVTDLPLDLRESDVNNLEITLTTRVSTVTGTVTGADSKPLSDYTVVVFADDESKWTIWSRYVAITRTNSQGTFTFKGLPAASFIAVAVPSVVNGQWQDPAFLQKLRVSADAVRFPLIEEGTATVKVTVRK